MQEDEKGWRIVSTMEYCNVFMEFMSQNFRELPSMKEKVFPID